MTNDDTHEVASGPGAFRRLAGALGALVLTLAATIGMVGLSAAPSSATSAGCSVYSTSPNGNIPAGWLCLSVSGSGTNISSMRASWRQPSLCNWRIDWRIYYGGKTWWSSTGPAHMHCDRVTGERYRGAGYAPDGSKLCAQLIDIPTGGRYTSACVNINR